MIRINLSYVYRLAGNISPLTKLQGELKLSEIVFHVTRAHETLLELFGRSIYADYIRTSRNSANLLYDELDRLVQDIDNGTDKSLSSLEIYHLANLAKTYEAALNDEISVMPAFLVTAKGGYDVNVLVGENAQPEKLFHPDLLATVPSVQYDVEQAAKCLAFEAPTAAAFHLHRINEEVLKKYFDVATGGTKRPQGMGAQLLKLQKESKGCKKINSILDQIRRLHRNPVAHPDSNLQLQEAIELYGIISSAVSSMLRFIDEKELEEIMQYADEEELEDS